MVGGVGGGGFPRKANVSDILSHSMTSNCGIKN